MTVLEVLNLIIDYNVNEQYRLFSFTFFSARSLIYYTIVIAVLIIPIRYLYSRIHTTLSALSFIKIWVYILELIDNLKYISRIWAPITGLLTVSQSYLEN